MSISQQDSPAVADLDPADLPPAPGVITWAFGAGRLTLLAEADSPVQMVSALPAGTTSPVGRADAHALAAPLVELSTGVQGRRPASPHAQHRHYRDSAGLRFAGQAGGSSDGLDWLEVIQLDAQAGLVVRTRFEHHAGTAALRTWSSVTNTGAEPVSLRYLSGLNLTGFSLAPIATEPDRLRLAHARNAWDAEFRWQQTGLEAAGVVDIGHVGVGNDSSLGCFAVRGYGSWSTGDHLPVGAVMDTATGTAWTWQIEHNGPWQWQAMDRRRTLYVTMSGPTALDHDAAITVAPGDSFTGVPVSLAVSTGGLDGALGEMTAQRRAIRRPNADVVNCPVIFNDYMNCLMGDPTTDKLLPLVAAAARAGAEYFVIDAGWYSDEPGWWDSVGEWQPSTTRFPGGLGEVTEAITAAGMVPGLWLEPEVVGVNSPLLRRLPAAALFSRDGQPLTENGRHQLDFRHPAVIEHLDATIDRLVAEFGVGYFKFDYNLNIGHGTDVQASSPGAGLLGHNRAFSAWLDGVFARHPDLVIENCSSGGMRVDYAQLSRMNLQSTSDQTDPLAYVPIAASAPASLAPEQAAIWAYPQPDWSPDVNDLTVVNALLGRVHLSGRIDQLSPDAFDRVAAGVAAYKAIRARIRRSVGVWPLSLPGWYDAWVASGLADDDGTLLQVWRRPSAAGDSPESVQLPLPAYAGASVDVSAVYPKDTTATWSWSATDGVLTVTLPREPSAVVLSVAPTP